MPESLEEAGSHGDVHLLPQQLLALISLLAVVRAKQTYAKGAQIQSINLCAL